MMPGTEVQKVENSQGNPTTFLYRLNFKEKTDLMGNFHRKLE
jgi:hypothetical protein